jgi:CHAT domain-containing protein
MLPRFYQSWQVSGDAAAALRDAQLEQLKRLRAGQVRITSPFGPVTMPEHPSLWSGLILIGQP